MRATIAFLAVTLVDGSQQSVWAGVSRATEERDLNLLCFLGGYLSTERPGRRVFDLQESTLRTIHAESAGPGRGATFTLRFQPHLEGAS